MPIYDVFISYSHAAERPVAIALQKALSQFARPWYKLRALRAFRDDASLSANAALWPSIQKALDDAEHFLLLASPESAKSEWVQREIEYWLQHKSSDRMLIAQTAGNLSWDSAAGDFEWSTTDALPAAMKGAFAEEPRYLDLRWARDNPSLTLRNTEFRGAVADLAAPLHGRPKDAMIGEDVVQHRRTIRVAWTAAIALGVLLIAALVAGNQALLQRDEALRQRDLALSRQLAASAEIVRDDRIDLSLLLSLHALRYADTPEARSALLAGLQTTAGIELYLPAETGATRAKFTPDGNRLLVATPSLVEARDPRSGEVMFEFAATDCIGAILNDFAIHPEGRTVAVAYGDGTVQMWETDTGNPLGEPLVEHQVTESACADYSAHLEGLGLWAPAMKGVAFDADGQRLAATNGRGEVFIWALDDAGPSLVYDARISNLASGDMYIGMGGTSIDFLPDPYLLVGGIGVLDLVDYENNQHWVVDDFLQSDEVLFQPAMHADVLNQPAFIIAVAGTESRSLWGGGTKDQQVVRLFMSSFEEEPIRLTADGAGELSIVALSPDRRFVAAGDQAGNIWAWDLSRQALISGPMTTHGGPVSELQFHPRQEAHLVSTSEDGSVVVRDLEAAHVRLAIADKPHQVRAVSVDFKDDNTSVAIGYTASWSDQHSGIRLFDYPSLLPVADGNAGTDDLLGVKFLGDGAGLLGVTADGKLTTWAVDPTGTIDRIASFDTGVSVADFEISADGQLAALVGEDGRVSIWDIADSVQVDLVEPENGAAAVAFIDNSTILFNDRRQWNLQLHRIAGRGDETAARAASEPLHFASSIGIRRIVTSRDGSIAALGFSSGEVQLVSLPDWRPLRLATAKHTSGIGALALSPDGYIAAVNGKEIQLWDAGKIHPVARPFVFEDRVILNAAYSQDGKRLAIGMADGDVFFIDVDVASWQSRACAIAHRELTPVEWNEYIGEGIEPRKACANRQADCCPSTQNPFGFTRHSDGSSVPGLLIGVSKPAAGSLQR